MSLLARRAPGAVLLLCLLCATPAARAACPGDCDGDGTVTVGELVTGVNIALGSLSVTACPSFDTNDNHMVEVSELIAAVNAALNGCPPAPSPTPTIVIATPTIVIEPIFPANYRDTFTEVRNCRLGIEHGGVMIRVLANPVAAEPYRNLQNPLPPGSIVIKEEYNGVDCSDAGLVSWSAMRKEPGFDPTDGDWHWQRLAAPLRNVICASKDDCPGFTCTSSGCHRLPECLARDYMCTADTTPRGTLQPVLQNLPAALVSVSGTSPTDVYAVGADAKDGHGPYVIHYNGSAWKRLDTGITSGGLWWISVTPIPPIGGDFYMAGDNGVILQFDPSSGTFTRQTTPDTSQLYGIWGTAANNLWAVGGNTQNQQAVVWHYDGTMWTVQNLSGVVPSGTPNLYKVWGRSATDVFAVGDNGVILHFDGMSWALLTSGVTYSLFTVHGTDLVLTAVGGFLPTGVILEQQSDGSFRDHAPSGTPQMPGTPQMNGVFVPPNGNAVAVGVDFSVATRDSSGWTLVNDGTSDTKGRDFHGTWVDASDGIWAVGGNLGNNPPDNGILSYGGPQSVAPGPVQ